MKITKQKAVSYLGYIVAAGIGFVLYCILRTTVIPLIPGSLKGDLDAVKASLPARSADGFLVVQSLTYDEHYNVTFELSWDPRGLRSAAPDDAGKTPEELFHSLSVSDRFCSNNAVKAIFRAGGTITVNMILAGTPEKRTLMLSCGDSE